MKIVKIFFILIILSIPACFLKESSIFTESSNSQNQQYVLGSSDIPLFSGLELIEEESTNFDTISGDIVISKYIGNLKLKIVKEFYLTALPQLGWELVDEKSDKISFKREKDKLEIKLDYASQGLYVRFFISSTLQ